MKNKKLYIYSSIIFVILLIILAFGKIDYNISNTLVNHNAKWALFFRDFGASPFLIIIFVFLIVYTTSRKTTGNKYDLILKIISYVCIFISEYALIFMPVMYEFPEKSKYYYNSYVLIATIIIFVITVFLMRKIPKELTTKYRKSALLALLVVISELILVNVLKIVWARPRMRSLESFDQFKYWWQINGPMNSEEFKSFPSGHTANAFVAVAFSSFASTPKMKRNIFIFGMIWGLLTAISRVVLGAHFLSDVTFSGYFTVIIFFIYDQVFYK